MGRFIRSIIIGILLVGIVIGTGVYATIQVASSNVTFDNSNSTLTSTNVQDALDELYLKINPPAAGEGTLFYQMASNAVLDNISSDFVTSSTGIDFSAVSSDTNGKGVYELSSTKDDAYPIYYYRGAVEDNNVLFANFCWKIVRTTETGGIKLIYNGTSTDGQCNNTGSSCQIGLSQFNSSYDYNAYVGYMYGTPNSSTYEAEHANINNSTIKTAIDTWYQDNMTSYTNQLEDTIWCNDRSVYSGNGYGTSATSYGAYNRLYTNKILSLVCSQGNDRFTVSTDNGNGALTYPVGLLTEDERNYAGGVRYSYDENYYLYVGAFWWTMTPYIFNSSNYGAHMFYGDSQHPANDYVAMGMYVRPAISLKPGTTYLSGTGIVSDPYVVE